MALRISGSSFHRNVAGPGLATVTLPPVGLAGTRSTDGVFLTSAAAAGSTGAAVGEVNDSDPVLKTKKTMVATRRPRRMPRENFMDLRF